MGGTTGSLSHCCNWLWILGTVEQRCFWWTCRKHPLTPRCSCAGSCFSQGRSKTLRIIRCSRSVPVVIYSAWLLLVFSQGNLQMLAHPNFVGLICSSTTGV